MTTEITQQLTRLLQPLLAVPLIERGEPSPERPYAELFIRACEPIGMGNEVAQGVDDGGNIAIRVQRRAEIVIHYYGVGSTEGVAQLSNIMDRLQSITLAQQLQMANIGVEGGARLETAQKTGEHAPYSAPCLSFPIHYSLTFNDPVGVIENVHAATDGGVKKIKLTR